ncbi:uncharacterized protein LOC144610035 isoform X1 [Rhinoraja longicauda]
MQRLCNRELLIWLGGLTYVTACCGLPGAASNERQAEHAKLQKNAPTDQHSITTQQRGMGRGRRCNRFRVVSPSTLQPDIVELAVPVWDRPPKLQLRETADLPLWSWRSLVRGQLRELQAAGTSTAPIAGASTVPTALTVE